MSRRSMRLVAIGLVVLLGVSTVGVALVAGGGASGPEVADTPTAPTTPAGTARPTAADTAACEEPGLEPTPPAPVDRGYCSRPPMIIDRAASWRATITTGEGDIVVALADDRAPVAVNNLVYLARDGYYRDVPFHRVQRGFVIQGGDPTGTGTGCLDADCTTRLPGYTFADELAGAEALVAEHGGYPRGTVAMANAGPDTNGSQFFVVQGRLVELPPDYTVLGRVTAGMDVVDAIAAGPNGDRITDDPVLIHDVTVDTAASAPGTPPATAPATPTTAPATPTTPPARTTTPTTRS